MEQNKLKLIDFSNGIRSVEIEHNFQALQSQIEEERISVAGKGVADGFEFSLSNFSLKIAKGSFISETGERVYIEEEIVEIEKPILLNNTEKLKVVDENLRIYLHNTPYSNDRLHPSDSLEDFETELSGITIKKSGLAGDAANVYISDISKNVLTLSPLNSIANGSKVDINYNYTFKRRDVVFINKEHEVEYRIGTTSPSPSVPEVSEEDYLYILGYVEVNGHEMLNEETNIIGASVKIVKEFKSVRNVYTDKDNNLYLCGTPFSALKNINMVEPTNPTEGTFWYDTYTNKLKVWRHTDIFTFADQVEFTGSNPNQDFKVTTGIEYLCNQGQLSVYINREPLSKDHFIEGTDFTEDEKLKGLIYSKEFTVTTPLNKGDKVGYRIERYDGLAEWVAISDSTYVPVREHFIFTPEIMDNYETERFFNKQHFLFHSDDNRNMLFVPDTNALTILLDQIPLHKDQYSEVTLKDAIAGEDSPYLNRVLRDHYGFTGDMSAAIMNEQYENIGVGFKISSPLLRKSYVEAIVEHRINTNPLTKRFQRSATFIADGVFDYVKYVNVRNAVTIVDPIFVTSVNFKYQEHQLEVFVNGRRLVRDREFIEIANENSLRGALIDSFKILEEANLQSGDKVEYKITTSIYSYDHLTTIFEDYENSLDKVNRKLDESLSTISNATEQIVEKVKEVDAQIEKLNNIENNLTGKFLTTDVKIGKANIETEIYKSIPLECFYQNIQIEETNQRINISSICNSKDFLNVCNISQNQGNKILRRDIDFSVITDGEYTFLNINTESVTVGSYLYVSGIKFRRA